VTRRFGPKQADHPSVGDVCRACSELFDVGDFTALIPLGPGGDPEARKARDEGRAYNAVAIEIHYECADH
jgi:hypothetical protein